MKTKRLILVAVFFAALVGCSNKDGELGGSGLLEADEAVVASETAGRVMELRFDEGTNVTSGDTLLVIDPSRLELELTSAIAGRKVALVQLESSRLQWQKAKETGAYAEKERDRIATLVKAGTSTRKQWDQLEHELTQAKLNQETTRAAVEGAEATINKIDADINQLERLLNDSYPLAPLSGVVTEKYIEAGEYVTPGKPIAKISRLDSLWVKVYLPTGDFANVKVGGAAKIDTEAGGKIYQGVIVWTSDEAEFTPKNVQTKKSRTNLVYAVKVAIANNDGSLKIGMPVYVTIGQL